MFLDDMFRHVNFRVRFLVTELTLVMCIVRFVNSFIFHFRLRWHFMHTPHIQVTIKLPWHIQTSSSTGSHIYFIHPFFFMWHVRHNIRQSFVFLYCNQPRFLGFFKWSIVNSSGDLHSTHWKLSRSSIFNMSLALCTEWFALIVHDLSRTRSTLSVNSVAITPHLIQ